MLIKDFDASAHSRHEVAIRGALQELFLQLAGARPLNQRIIVLNLLTWPARSPNLLLCRIPPYICQCKWFVLGHDFGLCYFRFWLGL